MSVLDPVRTVLKKTFSDQWAAYFQADEEEEGDRFSTWVPFDVWQDMGRPTTITLTVERGDMVNPIDPNRFAAIYPELTEPDATA